MKQHLRIMAGFVLVFIMLAGNTLLVKANLEVEAPSAILVEVSTGQVIYEKNATERLSPASITKIMTLLLVFEEIGAGKISLEDEIITSDYAASMGGSQVFLESGEIQSLETMIKCIAVASANDASVAVAEAISGSEQAFVDRMNEKAVSLGMVDTHFEDVCGLTDSDLHYTSAKDVAIMSRELVTKYPEIYSYSQIWMEDIVHETSRGSESFTLSSTNRLLKQNNYVTGLKTGSTSKAKFCISATGEKDDLELISVVMGAETSNARFNDAERMLQYGFSVSQVFEDENKEEIENIPINGAVEESVAVRFVDEFHYLDILGRDLTQITKELELPKVVEAPVEEGDVAGHAVYMLNGEEIGRLEIVYESSCEKADFLDYFWKAINFVFP